MAVILEWEAVCLPYVILQQTSPPHQPKDKYSYFIHIIACQSITSLLNELEICLHEKCFVLYNQNSVLFFYLLCVLDLAYVGLNDSTFELKKIKNSGICLYIPLSAKRPADDVQPVPEEN